MKKISWKDAAELIGIAAIVVSLVFLALQIRQQQLSADAEAVVASAALLAEVTQSINENREIWVKGLKGEELSELDESVFNRLAMGVWRYKASQILRAQRLTIGDVDRQAERYAYELYIYPGLRRWFDEAGAHLNESRAVFGREPMGPGTAYFAVQEALAQIDQLTPQMPETRSYDIGY